MKKLKKILALSCALLMAVTITACGTSESENNIESKQTTEAEKTTQSADTNVLVAYFSATGNTKTVAEQIADVTGGELYEIEPAEPYTSEDLDYNNDDCRANLEMNDDTVRPEIAGAIENIEQYDTIYLGYPIWWGNAPRIMNTFVETYDLSGKTVVPFCTSGGSGISTSVDTLQELAGDGITWMEGQRFDRDVSADEISQWIDEMGL
ncbi:MAG TPA: NAD(P)H-dependent oxidoreductase [Candidatus Eubacterium pullicola]|nr:NAD(P)H-dependent oxidoreductase [Candidatus Eubacterium pullicola]